MIFAHIGIYVSVFLISPFVNNCFLRTTMITAQTSDTLV